MKFVDLVNAVSYDFTEVRPYVFESSNGPQNEVEPNSDIIASPFVKFSVELDSGWLTTAEDSGDFKIGVIFCEELSVDDYVFIVGMEVMGKPLYLRVSQFGVEKYSDGVFVRATTDRAMYENTRSIVHSQLAKLHSGRIGLVNYGRKAKYKNSDGRKLVYKAKDVIYISNSKDVQKVGGSRITKGIVWQDAWEVGAHWRRIGKDSLGLNRSGERVEKGYTWLKSYTKGPDRPINTKVRKVKI
jgi:hypothetical protein